MRRSCSVLGIILLLSGYIGLIYYFYGINMLERWFPKKRVFTTVVIDAGHGAHDPGAVVNGIYEKEATLVVALKLEAKLLESGLKVELTRARDVFLPLEERARIGNKYAHAIFISIHFNMSANTNASGIETFYYIREEEKMHHTAMIGETLGTTNGAEELRGVKVPSEILAEMVQRGMIRQTQAVDRKIHQRNFSVLRNSRHPAILVEGGFLSNPQEMERIKKHEYLDQLVLGITEGILEFRKTQALLYLK